MQPPSPIEPAPDAPTGLRPPGRLAFALAATAIALMALLAYFNSFRVPFYFDDSQGITENKTIETMWPLWRPFKAPESYNSGAVGRPLVNFSLAVNYQISLAFSDTKDGREASGLNPWSYHAVNLAIHIATAWLVMMVLWRTLRRPVLAARFGAAAFPLAFLVALVWAVHPLASETVTNAIQRNESMVSFFYLLVIYCLLRATNAPWAEGWQWGAPRIIWWQAGAVLACFLGVISKEVMFSAPLMAILYDRTFVAGSFWEALKRRWGFYFAMASSWILLGFLVHHYKQRGGTVGFELQMTPWQYAMKSCDSIITYFKLSLWPHPLILDYGEDVPDHLTEVLPQGLLLLFILGLTAWALWRKPVLGFVGAWAFIILAPSSSIMPLTTQTEAEHRMYLPLAGIVALAVLGAYRWIGRQVYPLAGTVAIFFTLLTHTRNIDYRTELTMWRDDVAKRPENQRAHYNYGCALLSAGRYIDASSEFILALKLDPEGNADLTTNSHTNLGACYADLGDMPNAMVEYRAALARSPNDVQSNYNLGCALWDLNDLDNAAEHLRLATENDPDYGDAQAAYGAVLLLNGHGPDALQPLLAALAVDPTNTRTLSFYGSALREYDRLDNAIVVFQKALTLAPDSAELHKKLADAYAEKNEVEQALAEDAEAVRLLPRFAEAHFQFGNHYAKFGRYAEAVAAYTEALQLNHDYAEAENGLGSALLSLKRNAEARAAFTRALVIKPGLADARLNLGRALFTDGQLEQAETQFRQALQTDPNLAEAHRQLGLLLMEEKRLVEALVEFQEVLRINPDDDDVKASVEAALNGK